MVHYLKTPLIAIPLAYIAVSGALPRSTYTDVALLIRLLDATVRLLNYLNYHPPCGHRKNKTDAAQ